MTTRSNDHPLSSTSLGPLPLPTVTSSPLLHHPLSTITTYSNPTAMALPPAGNNNGALPLPSLSTSSSSTLVSNHPLSPTASRIVYSTTQQLPMFATPQPSSAYSSSPSLPLPLPLANNSHSSSAVTGPLADMEPMSIGDASIDGNTLVHDRQLSDSERLANELSRLFNGTIPPVRASSLSTPPSRDLRGLQSLAVIIDCLA
jgi:hypothetical protein